MVYRWLFIWFHSGGLTSGDPAVVQSAENCDPHPFATVLISFDGARLGVGAVNWSPAAAWLKKEGARPPRSMPTISSHQMSNTLNLMYQQILLNYSDTAAMRVRMHTCLCVCPVALNGVHMPVCVQLSEHTQACWCLHIRGGPGWVGWGGSEVAGYTSCNMLQRRGNFL